MVPQPKREEWHALAQHVQGAHGTCGYAKLFIRCDLLRNVSRAHCARYELLVRMPRGDCFGAGFANKFNAQPTNAATNHCGAQTGSALRLGIEYGIATSDIHHHWVNHAHSVSERDAVSFTRSPTGLVVGAM